MTTHEFAQSDDELPPQPGSSMDEESAERPSWLTGAEEGTVARPLDAHDTPEESSSADPTEASRRVTLRRPGQAAPVDLDQTARGLKLVPPIKGEAPASKPTWSTPSSSVPKLALVPEETAVPVMDEDDSAERDPGYLDEGFPGGGLDDKAEAPTTGPLLKPMNEPWWVVWGERAMTDRRIHLALLALLIIAGVFAFWPNEERGIAIREIKRHADTFEGQTVRVQGRVGDVFPLGDGYLFNLHQGRDTVVVYSRLRVPVSREHVSLVGSVSTGYLDGVPRVAVFEKPSE